MGNLYIEVVKVKFYNKHERKAMKIPKGMVKLLNDLYEDYE